MKLHKVLPWVAVIVSVAAAAYVAFYFSTAEAVYSRGVGNISVAAFVPYGGNGTEFVELSFAGVLGDPDSVANLEGWKLTNGADFVYPLDNVLLTTDNVRICEGGVTDPTCDISYGAENVFADDGGELLVIARDNTPAIHITYGSEVYSGQELSFDGNLNYIDDVYTTKDKVAICVLKPGGEYQSRNASSNKLANDFERGATSADIIPPFVYETNKGALGYHTGSNWSEEQKAVWQNGCVQ
jgi:hypothetical protein